MIGIEHLVWGGGYKDHLHTGPKNYWLTTQHVSRGDSTINVGTLQRFYSGASIMYSTYFGEGIGYIMPGSMIVGQIGNNIYILTNNTLYNAPILKYGYGADYIDYIEVTTDKDAILDYLPESWLLYAKDVIGDDLTSKRIYCYNHDTLVADGIEQS